VHERLVSLAAALLLAGAGCGGRQPGAANGEAQSPVERGRYLVAVAACNDCHTPMTAGPQGPQPALARLLSGHPQELTLPPPPPLLPGSWSWAGTMTNTAFAGAWGISYAANLTPDGESGIGNWTEDTFIEVLRSNRHWTGDRPIMPPMPRFSYSQMTDEDLKAVFAYLKSIKPVRNIVPEYQSPERGAP
jgi:mono/diheme cytochrome c family protein